MLTAIKLFFTGLPFKNLAWWAIGLLIVSNAIAYGFMYKAKVDAVFWKGEYKGAIIGFNTAKEIREDQNAVKAEQDKKRQKIANELYQKQLAALKISSEKDRLKLKSELELAHEKIKLANYRLNAAYDRVRLHDQIPSSARSEASSEATHPAAESECDGIIDYGKTLERGCALTTIDFNRCSKWIEDVCAVHGCG